MQDLGHRGGLKVPPCPTGVVECTPVDRAFGTFDAGHFWLLKYLIDSGCSWGRN